MERLNITVIGGSASTNVGLPTAQSPWPLLLETQLSDGASINHISLGGLTLIRALDILANEDKSDLIIFHFGTSVGWPISLVKMNKRLGIDFETEHGFHQPLAKSKSLKRRIRGFLRLRFRNFVKYVLFFMGLYKPSVGPRELGDQVNTVLHHAFRLSPKVIWIQHAARVDARIFLERRIYKRFYLQILKSLRAHGSEDLYVIEYSHPFIHGDNYINDGVHLTFHGHQEVLKKVMKGIQQLFPNG
jgi:hypothetical protein